jgi:hypothetical protein
MAVSYGLPPSPGHPTNPRRQLIPASDATEGRPSPALCAQQIASRLLRRHTSRAQILQIPPQRRGAQREREQFGIRDQLDEKQECNQLADFKRRPLKFQARLRYAHKPSRTLHLIGLLQEFGRKRVQRPVLGQLTAAVLPIPRSQDSPAAELFGSGVSQRSPASSQTSAPSRLTRLKLTCSEASSQMCSIRDAALVGVSLPTLQWRKEPVQGCPWRVRE